jgi:hypothetical protein
VPVEAGDTVKFGTPKAVFKMPEKSDGDFLWLGRMGGKSSLQRSVMNRGVS